MRYVVSFWHFWYSDSADTRAVVLMSLFFLEIARPNATTSNNCECPARLDARDAPARCHRADGEGQEKNEP